MTRRAIDQYYGIGTNIRRLRKAKGFTQRGFAEILGIPVSSYSNYENNNRTPSLDLLKEIAKLLNVDLHKILGVANPAEVITLDTVRDSIQKSNLEILLDDIDFTIETNPDFVLVTDQRSNAKYRVSHELWESIENDILEYARSRCMCMLLSEAQKVMDDPQENLEN